MAHQGYTMPPPSLGLDLVSPIDNMDPASALELTNIFPGAGAPTVRGGYTQFADLSSVVGGSSAPVRMMAEMPLRDGTRQLIAAQDTKLFSINSVGAITNITGAAGPYASGRWNYTLFSNIAGTNNYIYLANAYGDAPQVYLGSGVAQTINATCRSGPAITELSNVFLYRFRLYFIQRNSLTMWYDKTVGATGGATMTGTSSTLDSYDFSGIMRRGGSLLFLGNYTNQNGINPQDYFVAITTEGEIAVYSGSSPDANTGSDVWSLVAHFQIGRPLGPKAFVRVNQDFWIITQQGIVPMSALFQTDPEQALNIVSRPINPLITQYASQVTLSEMWTGFFWGFGRRVYVTLPDSAGSATLLVYSIDTKAWTQFVLYSGDHCVSSCRYDFNPYYGSNTGLIFKGEDGTRDAVLANGTSQAITFTCRTAFSFYGSRGNYKAFKDIRPLIKTKRGVQLTLGLDTDFKRMPVLASVSTSTANYTKWGSTGGTPTFTQWGSNGNAYTPYKYPGDTPVTITVPQYTQPWSSDVEYIYDRHAVSGQGTSAAIRMAGSIINTTLQIIGFEVRYDLGGQV